MKTSLILYRVADFLRQHPPFQSVRLDELLPLARSGRVSFHAANEYVYRQGQPFRPLIWVIQQGSVELIDESTGVPEIRDLLSAGDILGADRFGAGESYGYSARTAGDVIVYALDASVLAELREHSAAVDRYLRALLGDTAAAHSDKGWLPVSAAHEAIVRAHLVVTDQARTMAGTAEAMLAAHSQVAVVEGSEGGVAGVVTDLVLRNALSSGASADLPVSRFMLTGFPTARPEDRLERMILQMVKERSPFVVVTADGTRDSAAQGAITETTVQLLNGVSPSTLIRRTRHAGSLEELALLRERVYAFVETYLLDASAVEWFCEFVSHYLTAVTARILELCSAPAETALPYCWMFFGAAARGELLTPTIPLGAIVTTAEDGLAPLQQLHARVMQAYEVCGFSPPERKECDLPPVHSLNHLLERYLGILRLPVHNDIYANRVLFDFFPAAGDRSLADRLRDGIRDELALGGHAAALLGNDCLQSFPPLTLYQNLVVGMDGSRREELDLSATALQPLTDVGRVFALAAGDPVPAGTIARFLQGARRAELQGHLTDAADAFRILLLEQARNGIRDRDEGRIVYPVMMGRYEQILLKSAFRSIQRVLEFTYAYAFSLAH